MPFETVPRLRLSGIDVAKITVTIPDEKDLRKQGRNQHPEEDKHLHLILKRRYGAFDAKLGRYAIPSNKLSVGTGTGSAGIIISCVIAPVVTSKLGRKIAFVIMSGLITTGIVIKSPRFLIYRSRFDEAEVVLRSLSNHPETVPQEIDLLKAQVEEQRQNHAAVTVLNYFRGTNLRRTIIAISVQIL
ncbi:hypothetical protein CSHISOI_11126 [Colletotrichum shisoi]|uniref:Uncharacterized protein n=1 Tax=Colletotrichum shisoi TaxID=2078593 RepID=A0A5Q4BC36_9PEZI|nr:hypothetical protein CSHISOI_11126 [Colletotrichum shisoi]